MDRKTNPNRYWEEAERLRAEAATIKDSVELRASYLDLAEGFERLAEVLANRQLVTQDEG